MLFRLELENFYSVRDLQVIDLRLADNVPAIAHRFAPIHLGYKWRAPKVVTIFGPNASGKSMVLRGLTFLSWFVQHSFLQLPVRLINRRLALAFSPANDSIRGTPPTSSLDFVRILPEHLISLSPPKSEIVFAGTPMRSAFAVSLRLMASFASREQSCMRACANGPNRPASRFESSSAMSEEKSLQARNSA